MVEKAENPTKAKSQKPDEQNKTTMERVEKQEVEVGEDGAETVTTGDFTKATASPDKEG